MNSIENQLSLKAVIEPIDGPFDDDETLDEVLDLQGVMNRVCGNFEFLQLLIVIFREDCAKNVESLHAALLDNDLAGIAETAHKLKGVVGNLGGTKAWRHARAIENFARAGKLKAVAPALRQFELALAELTTSLNKIVLREGEVLIDNGASLSDDLAESTTFDI